MHKQIALYRNWAILSTVLLILSSAAAVWMWQKNNSLSDEFLAQDQTIAALEAERGRLNASIDSLSNAYDYIRAENDSLQGAVAKSEHLIREKAAEIDRIRRKSTRNLKELREQVTEMQKAKTEMETVLSLLRAENAQLKAENARLAGENEQLRGEKDQLSSQVGDLAEKLAEQIRKTQSARFKASSFRVEVERKGDKQTTRAKRVREIMVSFDLADVPETYQGPQKLYLVISDDKGVPITSANPIKVTIDAPSGAIPIIAQQSKNIQMTQTQRLQFTHKLDDRLKKGHYLASIYCANGLLGVAGFRLS